MRLKAAAWKGHQGLRGRGGAGSGQHGGAGARGPPGDGDATGPAAPGIQCPGEPHTPGGKPRGRGEGTRAAAPPRAPPRFPVAPAAQGGLRQDVGQHGVVGVAHAEVGEQRAEGAARVPPAPPGRRRHDTPAAAPLPARAPLPIEARSGRDVDSRGGTNYRGRGCGGVRGCRGNGAGEELEVHTPLWAAHEEPRPLSPARAPPGPAARHPAGAPGSRSPPPPGARLPSRPLVRAPPVPPSTPRGPPPAPLKARGAATPFATPSRDPRVPACPRDLGAAPRPLLPERGPIPTLTPPSDPARRNGHRGGDTGRAPGRPL